MLFMTHDHHFFNAKFPPGEQEQSSLESFENQRLLQHAFDVPQKKPCWKRWKKNGESKGGGAVCLCQFTASIHFWSILVKKIFRDRKHDLFFLPQIGGDCKGKPALFQEKSLDW